MQVQVVEECVAEEMPRELKGLEQSTQEECRMVVVGQQEQGVEAVVVLQELGGLVQSTQEERRMVVVGQQGRGVEAVKLGD